MDVCMCTCMCNSIAFKVCYHVLDVIFPMPHDGGCEIKIIVIVGALNGGVPMSHVELKKRQCRMSVSLGK